MWESLLVLEGVEDPGRSDATSRNLHGMLAITLLCVLAYGEGCAGMERCGRGKKPSLRKFMKLDHGTRSLDRFLTCSRIRHARTPSWF